MRQARGSCVLLSHWHPQSQGMADPELAGPRVGRLGEPFARGGSWAPLPILLCDFNLVSDPLWATFLPGLQKPTPALSFVWVTMERGLSPGDPSGVEGSGQKAHPALNLALRLDVRTAPVHTLRTGSSCSGLSPGRALGEEGMVTP